jgi:hypothetical protein
VWERKQGEENSWEWVVVVVEGKWDFELYEEVVGFVGELERYGCSYAS